MSYLVLFFLVFFSPFSIAITSLGEERANLSAFRTFVRFMLACFFFRFPLPLGRAAVCNCSSLDFSRTFFFVSCLVLSCSCVFRPFSIATTTLREEKANLSVFRTFVRFALVWFWLFPLGVWEGLRFVIVALPAIFSYHFFYDSYTDGSFTLANSNSFLSP